MAGYSGKPLPDKLGIKPGHRVLLSGAPDGFALEPLPDAVTPHRRAGPRVCYDLILAFAPNLAALTAAFPVLRDRTETAGSLWIAWPKKASGVPTDLDENRVREVGAEGMVDVKVAAVDDTWSGLKFVRRLADR